MQCRWSRLQAKQPRRHTNVRMGEVRRERQGHMTFVASGLMARRHSRTVPTSNAAYVALTEREPPTDSRDFIKRHARRVCASDFVGCSGISLKILRPDTNVDTRR